METIRSFRDLHVWQKAVELAVKVYRITSSFPKPEQYGLTSQMRRAAVSVGSNIAEGHRRSNPDFARYLTMALGSLAELETQVEISRRIEYLSREVYDDLLDEMNQLGRQLTTLHHRVTDSMPKPATNNQQPVTDRQHPTTDSQ